MNGCEKCTIVYIHICEWVEKWVERFAMIQTWVHIPFLSFSCCMSLGKLLNLSESHLPDGANQWYTSKCFTTGSPRRRKVLLCSACWFKHLSSSWPIFLSMEWNFSCYFIICCLINQTVMSVSSHSHIEKADSHKLMKHHHFLKLRCLLSYISSYELSLQWEVCIYLCLLKIYSWKNSGKALRSVYGT